MLGRLRTKQFRSLVTHHLTASLASVLVPITLVRQLRASLEELQDQRIWFATHPGQLSKDQQMLSSVKEPQPASREVAEFTVQQSNARQTISQCYSTPLNSNSPKAVSETHMSVSR